MNYLFKFKTIMSVLAIIYIWSLPVLSLYGFTEPNSKSISGYIGNPPATGAMGALSFIPLTLVWEYQDLILETIIKRKKCKWIWLSKVLYCTTITFQTSYGAFLICTYGYVKDWIHSTTVIVFSTSFLIHALVMLYYTEPSVISKGILVTGVGSGLGLIILECNNVSTMWFWALECVGLTSIFIFTPVEWITLNLTNKLSESYIDDGCGNYILEEMKEGLIEGDKV